jgi:hypothetical protein
VHATHPLTVAFGQVVVDRDDVDAVAAQGIEVGGQHTGQGLALTGLHLGDVAEVQGGATHHLNVERTLVEHPPGRLAGHRVGLGQDVVERRAIGDALLELVGLGTEFGVGQRLDVIGQAVDIVGDLLEALDHAAFADAEHFRQHVDFPLLNEMQMSLGVPPS